MEGTTVYKKYKVYFRFSTQESSGIAQSTRAPYSNCKVASSMPALGTTVAGITRWCIRGKNTKR